MPPGHHWTENMLSPHDPCQNALLAALPAAERQQIFPKLELVPMPLGNTIYQPGIQMRHVYFPTTSIVSLLMLTTNGSTAEIAGVGNEGIVGVPIFMGGNSTTSWAVVQSAGYAFRLSGPRLKEQFCRSAPTQRLLMHYSQVLLTEIAQTAVCNRHHSVDRQLCRWLLLSLDRLVSNDLTVTQKLIAHMLGVRRESVTEAVGRLQHAGLIYCTRGSITVINRAGLEARACECYRIVKTAFDRLLSIQATGTDHQNLESGARPPRVRHETQHTATVAKVPTKASVSRLCICQTCGKGNQHPPVRTEMTGGVAGSTASR